MTPKMQKFCEQFVIIGEAKAAAKAAGYSDSYAHSKANLLLKKDEVVIEIRRLQDRLKQKAEKSATDVVNEYARIAFTDRVDFLKPDPWREGFFVYKSPDELSDEQRAIVEKVTTHVEEITLSNGEGTEKRKRQRYNYVLADKANALQQMGRHFGIFDDNLRLSGPQHNPFMKATPEQLEKLKEAYINTMSDPKLIEGQYEEVSNGKA